MRSIAFAAAGVDIREVEGQFVGPQLDKQVEHFGKNFSGPGVRTVHLVDYNDRLQADLERLFDDVPGLRTRSLEGVDENQGPVGHRQHALDLAAKVGVARRVDDVDFDALVDQGDVFGEDRDAPFPLQIVGIEDAVARELGVAKLTALTQQGIDQGRLAVVDVCNDGDIADIGASHGISELVCRKRLTGRVAGEARGTRAGRTLSGGPGR